MSANARPCPGATDRERVLDALYCRRGAVRRRELVAATGLSDRVVRASIARLVVDGAPIVSDRVSGGYELLTDPTRIKAECNRLFSAAARTRERAEALQRHLETHQAELFPQAASA